MKTTTVAKVATAIKKAGLERSDVNIGNGRIKGWCSSIREGAEIAAVFPWVTRYTRKGSYFYSYITDAYQETEVKWQTSGGRIGGPSEADKLSEQNAPANFEKLKAALTAAGIEFAPKSSLSVTVRIENPNANAAELNKKENERMQAHRGLHRRSQGGTQAGINRPTDSP